MPHWVKTKHTKASSIFNKLIIGADSVFTMAAVAASHESTGEADNAQNHPNDESHGEARNEGKVVKVAARKRSRHGRRFQVH